MHLPESQLTPPSLAGTRTVLDCRFVRVSKSLPLFGSRFLAEMQAQLDKISAKLDLIAADVKEISENVRPNPQPETLNPKP